MVNTSVVDDDAISSDESLVEEIAVYLYPALRLVGALGVVWFCSTFSKYVCMCLAPQRHCLGSVSYSRLSCCGVIDQAAPNTHPFFKSWNKHRNQRQFAGILSASLAGFLTFTYLEPLFVPAGSDMAMVFLFLLVINSVLVGMSLGVLLPVLMVGICSGGALTLLAGSFLAITLQNSYYFPLVGGVMAALSAIGSYRYVLPHSHTHLETHR